MTFTETQPQNYPLQSPEDPFLMRVREALRPRRLPNGDIDPAGEADRAEELEALKAPELVREYRDALGLLIQDLEWQFSVRREAVEDGDEDPDDYEDWRRRANGFKRHLLRYHREAKQLARELTTRGEDGWKAEALRLRKAIHQHREALDPHVTCRIAPSWRQLLEDANTSLWAAVDTSLWAEGDEG